MQPNSTPITVDNIDSLIKKWRPADGWLIADGNQFVLPTHHRVFGQQFYKAYCRKAKVDIAILLVCNFLILICFTVMPVAASAIHILLFTVLLILAAVDKYLSTKSVDKCKQKVAFLFNVKCAFNKVLTVFAPFFTALFILQAALPSYYDGFENLVKAVGNYYPSISLMSSWRFLTGPIIHADFQHLILNAVLTVLFACAIPQSTRSNLLSLFVLGAVLSHFLTYTVNLIFHTPFDALLGISGGSFTLLAYAIASYWRLKQIHTAVALFAIFAYCEISLGLLSTNASHAAHISGFVVGIFANMARQTRSKIIKHTSP